MASHKVYFNKEAGNSITFSFTEAEFDQLYKAILATRLSRFTNTQAAAKMTFEIIQAKLDLEEGAK